MWAIFQKKIFPNVFPSGFFQNNSEIGMCAFSIGQYIRIEEFWFHIFNINNIIILFKKGSVTLPTGVVGLLLCIMCRYGFTAKWNILNSW